MMRRGFTLVELIIATTLSILVMVAAVNISTIMVRQHLQSVHRGEIHGQAMVVLDGMKNDIENASMVTISTVPAGGPPNSNMVAGCTNWSKVGATAAGAATAGPLDSTKKIHYFIYCIDNTRFGNLWRWGDDLSPAAPGIADCNTVPTAASCAANITDNKGNTSVLLITGDATKGTGISYLEGKSFYFAPSLNNGPAREIGGIEAVYIVGNSTPTADSTNGPGHYVPHYYKVDTKLNYLKSFNSTTD